MGAGAALLAASLAVQPVADWLTVHGQVLTAVILTSTFAAMLPGRLSLLALALAAVTFAALNLASEMKVRAVGLPLSYFDVASALSDPLALLHALGYRGPLLATLTILAVVALVVTLGLAYRLRPRSLGRTGLVLVQIVLVSVLGVLAVNAAARDLRDRLPILLPEIEQELWEPAGQQRLAQAAGPLTYLAFTRLAGDDDAAGLAGRPAPPLPLGEMARASESLVRMPATAPALLPNIVLLQAESTFDPNAIFRITRPVRLPLWAARAETRALTPLRVNVIGGGTWVTEFEILTGVDSRLFGYQGFYTHQMLAPRTRNAFPAFLAELGYATSAYYPEKAEYFGVGEAFRRYGFQRFHDAAALGIKPDWSDSDAAVIERFLAHGALTPAARPRFVYMATQQNHGPHPCENFAERGELAVRFAAEASLAQDCALNEFVLRARSTSAGMLLVLGALQELEARTGRPYVLLVYGDHQPWSFTDGRFSVAGGTATDGVMPSFQRFRTGRNDRITFFHLLSSRSDVALGPFPDAAPVTLLPTILSAFVTSQANDLYLPVNLYLYSRCGEDHQARTCLHREQAALWGREWLLGL